MKTYRTVSQFEYYFRQCVLCLCWGAFGLVAATLVFVLLAVWSQAIIALLKWLG